MLQVISKWRINIIFENGTNMIFYINENFHSNMLRKLGDLSFDNLVTGIAIDLVKE